MPRTSVIALSRHGASLACRLPGALGPDTTLHLERRFWSGDSGARAFDLPLRPVLRKIWAESDAVVLFLPVGAAVRLAAPLLRDKHNDPALVCVDDAGRFAVSVLSGHLGGADRLAEQVANAIGAMPVVTSGSHVTGTLAVDLLGREFGWKVEAPPNAVTRASAAAVNRDPVGVFQEAGESEWWTPDCPLPDNITLYPSLEDLGRSGSAAALVISDRTDPCRGLPEPAARRLSSAHTVLYRPRSLVAGMGCRRGVPLEELEELLVETFRANNLSLDSLGALATATIKQDEAGLVALAKKHGVRMVCYGPDELNAVFPEELAEPGGGATIGPGCDISDGSAITSAAGQTLHPSANARRLVGVWGVSEPAALLASGAGNLLVPKRMSARATIAIARREYGAPSGRREGD